jgi:hypothetical protein
MAVVKILMFVIVLNSFLYMSGFNLFDNDIIDRFVNIDEEAGKVTDYSQGSGNIGDSIPSQPQTGSLTAGSQGFSFIDALALVWDFLKFLLNIVFAPIGLFVGAGFPLVVQLGLGLPIGVAYIFGLIALLRGVGA